MKRAREVGCGRNGDGGAAGCIRALAAVAAVDTQALASVGVLAILLLVLGSCSALPPPKTGVPFAGRRFTSTVTLHGQPLELHLSAPAAPAVPNVLVLYASGDGGWIGTAVDMFRQAADAGFFAAGFSSRSFLKLERPHGAPLNTAQLAGDYRQIIARARAELGLEETARTVLTGWSRGAAFAVLVGSEFATHDGVFGVVAIGLAEGENLKISGPEDETDEGSAAPGKRGWQFENYARLAGVGERPCAVIQATGDGYLPAARARQLFGPDTPWRRFYEIDAKNHRFSGGGVAFHAAWLDAIRWIALPANPAK